MHYLPDPLSPELAAQLRAIFQTHGYTAGALAGLYQVKALCDVELHPSLRAPLPEAVDGLVALTAIFMDGGWMPAEKLRSLLGESGYQVLVQANLLHFEDDRACARFHIYPVGAMLIASDRWANPDGSPTEVHGDVVYPALNPNTERFLSLMPLSECESVLDIGAGTGVATILAAQHGAAAACASDIAPACTKFAEFNAALNGCANVSAVTSDAYAAFAGQTFDRIVCHPPYVPSILPRWVFYNGGEDGELITSRVIQGLPAHLRPGGLAFILTMGSDREDELFEQRVRQWLGEAEREFDVAFLIRNTINPVNFASRVTPKEVRTQDEFKALSELFKRLRVEDLQQGLLLIQRHKSKAHPFTLRRTTNEAFRREVWEWLLRWETAAVSDERLKILLDSTLHTGVPDLFDVKHRLEDDVWVPAGYMLTAKDPFIAECDADPWMANLIAICDGQTTGRELMRQLQRAGAIPPSTTAAEFAKALTGLVSGGFVEVEGFRPPRAAK